MDINCIKGWASLKDADGELGTSVNMTNIQN